MATGYIQMRDRYNNTDKARFKPKYFYQFRIILIGDSTVGKSSLLRQFTEGQFIETSDPTVGVDFHVRVVMLSGECNGFSFLKSSILLYFSILMLQFNEDVLHMILSFRCENIYL